MARSRAYPVFGLEDAVETAQLIQDSLGKGPHDRESIAHALGYSSSGGLPARKIAALVQYGLLDRDGSSYELTELSEQILTPRDDHEKREAIRTAFGKPPLFAELIAALQPQGRVPNQLANLLARDYQIQKKVSQDAAGIFLGSGQFAGILDGNGKFLSATDSAVEEDPPPEVERPQVDAPPPPPPGGVDVYSLKLSSGVADLRVPSSMTPTDIERLKLQFNTIIQLSTLAIADGEKGGK